MYLIRDFDSYKTVTCNRSSKKGVKNQNFLSKIIARLMDWMLPPALHETNVLQLLVDVPHKDLLSSLPVITGILEHKYQTFGRHLLLVWFVVVSCTFVVFELNVYMRDSESGQLLPASHPLVVLQIVLAAALLLFSFLYSLLQGLTPHVEIGHTGVAREFQTHRSEDDLRQPVDELIYAAQPFWLMPAYHDSVEKSNRFANLLARHQMLMEKSRVEVLDDVAVGSRPVQPYKLRSSVLSVQKTSMQAARCGVLMVKLVCLALFRTFFNGSGSTLQLWAAFVLIQRCVASTLANEDSEIASTALLGLASMCFFSSFLMFYRLSDRLGPFIVLISRMILGDLVMWILVVVLFVLGVAQMM
jgi:hypothetical protein